MGGRLVGLIADYTASFGNTSEDKAMNVVGEYLDIQADQVKGRRSSVDQFAKVLPGRKVALLSDREQDGDSLQPGLRDSCDRSERRRCEMRKSRWLRMMWVSSVMTTTMVRPC